MSQLDPETRARAERMQEVRRQVADETRTLTATVTWDPETRDGKNGSMKIRGYAAVFDSPSRPIGGEGRHGSFIETLRRGCFAKALSRSDADPQLLGFHDTSIILARRSAGTLKLAEDSHELRIEADVVNTTAGRDIVELIRTGHVREMSFGFTVGSDEWSDRSGQLYRDVTEVDRLLECSVLATPAYPAASVEAVGARLAADLEAIELRARVDAAKAKRANTNTDGAPVTPTQTRAQRELIRVREKSPYQPGGDHSYFRDLGILAHHAKLQQYKLGLSPEDQGPSLGDGSIPHPDLRTLDLSPEAAAKRLDQAAEESRALSNTLGAGGEFVVIHGVPAFIADEFATSAHTAAVVAGELKQRPLPEAGLAVETPLLGTAVNSGTAATVAIQTAEGNADSNTDPGSALANAPVVTISGYVDVARQWFDRNLPGLDETIASELGKAIGEKLETEIIQGPGGALRMTGLLNVTGIQSTTYTDASPTSAKVFASVAQVTSDTAGKLGHLPNLCVMHTRRWSWLMGKALAQLDGWPIRTVASNGIPTTQGASTNQDAVVVLDTNESVLFTGPVRCRVIEDASISSNLQVRVQCSMYAALLAHRAPYSIGVLTGTGLATPTWP
jgi:HK97 family phage prohead protease